MGSFSLTHWIIVLIIVVLIFGIKNCATSAKTSAVRFMTSNRG